MPAITPHLQTRLVAIDLAQPAGVAGDGWLARVLGEPPDVEGLAVAVAGEWMEGYALGDAVHPAAVAWWREHMFGCAN